MIVFRSRRLVVWSLQFGVLLGVCLGASPAVAQNSESGSSQRDRDERSEREKLSEAEGLDSLDPEEKKRLLERMKAARKAYSAGDFDRAIEEMKEARTIIENPEFLYRIGLSYERKDDPERAIEYYRKYLDEKPESKKRGRIEKTIETLEERLEQNETEDGATAGSGGSRNALSTAMYVTGGVLTGSALTFGYLSLDRRQKVREIRSRSRNVRRADTEFNRTVRQQNLFAGLTYGTAALAAGAFTWALFSDLGRGSNGDSASAGGPTGVAWQLQVQPRGVVVVRGRF